MICCCLLYTSVVAGRHELMKSIRTVALKHIGSPIGPQEAYLLQRGVKTLPLRMDAHLHNAQKVAEFLDAHPAVKKMCIRDRDMGIQVLVIDPEQQVVLGRARLHLARQLVVDDNACLLYTSR